MGAYMKIDGIDGNVTASGLEKTIEISSAHFGVKRNMNTKPGAVADREGSKPSVSEFTITKDVDITSPKLFSDAAVGTLIPSVVVNFANTGKNLSIYHTVTLTNVLVSGYELVHNNDATTADETANTKPQERVTFNFTKVEVKNTPYGADHKAGSPVAAAYNLQTAQAA